MTIRGRATENHPLGDSDGGKPGAPQAEPSTSANDAEQAITLMSILAAHARGCSCAVCEFARSERRPVDL